MENVDPIAKPAKPPLPGYRFLFTTFGILLLAGALWGIYSMLFGMRPAETAHPAVSGFAWLLAGGWLAAGITCILFAQRLRKGNLTERHWMFGLALTIACAVLMGLFFTVGYVFLFMALIWTDSDVKMHFR